MTQLKVDNYLVKAEQWSDASTVLSLREMAFRRVSESHPLTHPLFKHVEARLETAKANFETIASKL